FVDLERIEDLTKQLAEMEKRLSLQQIQQRVMVERSEESEKMRDKDGPERSPVADEDDNDEDDADLTPTHPERQHLPGNFSLPETVTLRRKPNSKVESAVKTDYVTPNFRFGNLKSQLDDKVSTNVRRKGGKEKH
ncbi:hypothetical protein PMAYCL1PPCAC_26454, partial [Pristionchus mayeri]